MSGAAERRAPAALLLAWSEQLGRWTGELEDGPFRLQITADRQGGGQWLVLLQDFAGQAEMMRELLELSLPESAHDTAIVERLQELGDTWKHDPSLVFQGWGRT